MYINILNLIIRWLCLGHYISLIWNARIISDEGNNKYIFSVYAYMQFSIAELKGHNFHNF